MSLSPSHWALLGGALCLDFTNTRSRNPAEKNFDFFWDYPALLQWGLQLELLTPAQADARLDLAGGRAGEAQAAVERARELRESIYAVFAAVAGGQAAPAADLAALNTAWGEALRHLQVSPGLGNFDWAWVGADGALDSLLWPVAQSAAELLISDNLNRVKRCGGCGWLFLDTTRDGRRRWCDMKVCGNRAKARRHYERQRSPTG